MAKVNSKTNTNQQNQASQQYQGANTNTYGYESAPINAQTQSVIDASQQPSGADPGIQGRFATMEENVRRSYQDPQGAYTTPFVRGRAQLEQIQNLETQADQAKRESYFQGQQADFGKKVAAAQLTNPTLVNTGGTTSANSNSQSSGVGTSNTSTGKNLFGQLEDISPGMAA